MSAPAPQQGSSRGLWIGAGVGCGCLSLLVAIVVVILVLGAVFRATSNQPAAQGGGAPAQPQGGGTPPQPQGGGAPAQPGGLQINVVMAKLDQNHQPVQQTNAFQAGDTVGAVSQMVAVPGDVTVVVAWLKVDGDNAAPLADPKPVRLSADAQGKATVFYLTGAPAGSYMFLIALPGSGDELREVAAAKFTIQ